VPPFAGQVKGRLSVIVRGVQVAGVGQQQFDHGQIAARHAVVEGTPATSKGW
jgi:hypothetical protein